METPNSVESFEDREPRIDGLINELAEREGMSLDDILSDIITFAPYEGNDSANPEYIEEIAEKIGVSVEEMNEYAINKAKEELGEL